MDPLKALMLGLLQGILEWLPISSQGNLVVLAMLFMNLEPLEALNFSVYLHLGTGIAALFYFRKEVIDILRRRSENSRDLFKFLFITTLITGLIGFPIFAFVKVVSFYGELLLALTGIALLAMGVMQKNQKDYDSRDSKKFTLSDGIIMGFAQGLSAIPGLSRSGITTSVLLLKGFSGNEALKISFLMSIPAVFTASAGLALIEGIPTIDLNIIFGLLASFLSALISIGILLKIAKRIEFWKLCVVLGTIAIIAVLPYLF